MGWVIWHKPTCSTSRWVLAALREAGITPEVRDYIAAPPSQAELRDALTQLGIDVRGLIRRKGTPFAERGLGAPDLSDDALIAAMTAHPILIERPVVFAPHGAVLCRPKERVIDLIASGAADSPW